MDLKEGASVAGKYRLEHRLGVGGMGEVWAATQTVTRKPVALKFLHETGAVADMHRRFLREARAACAVRHPNVVEIHDVIELDDGSPVMVMELLRGESLEQRLRREGKLPLRDLAAIMLRVVAAVGTAHALGIVHRDLKPDNVFLVETAEGTDVKVLDFGIAKLTAIEGDAAQTGGLTNTGAMLGTPYYMSPEQAFGEKRIDHRADIWSLGIILYRGLTGVLPTQADNIGQILKIIMTRSIPKLGQVAPDLPADVLAMVDKMLEADAGARPADLREVKAMLERHAGAIVEGFAEPPATAADAAVEGSSAAATAGPVSRTVAPSKSKVLPIALTAVAIAALSAALALLLGGGKPKEPQVAASIASVTAPAPPPATSPPDVTPPISSAITTSSAAPSSSGPRRVGRPPSALATVTATTTATAEPANTAKPSLGGVIEKPNF